MKALSRIILINIVGACATFLLVVFVVRPILGEVVSTNQTVKSKKSELNLIDQQILAFKTAQSDLSKATRKDEITNAIQPKENLVLAVHDLEAAAAHTNTTESLDVKDPVSTADSAAPKNPDVVAGKQSIKEVPYALTTLNDFSGTVNFLSYLEHLPHFTEISKILLTAETQESQQKTPVHTGKIIGSFNAVFFVKPTP
jgi:ABC-type transport system involved in cytochrome bd biosynthesis fused ATPase/permease subunit